MGLFLVYRDPVCSGFTGFVIYDRFEDTVEAGLRCRREFLDEGFRDVVLFRLGLDENLDDYLSDGSVFWEFVRKHEVKEALS